MATTVIVVPAMMVVVIIVGGDGGPARSAGGATQHGTGTPTDFIADGGTGRAAETTADGCVDRVVVQSHRRHAHAQRQRAGHADVSECAIFHCFSPVDPAQTQSLRTSS
tara:strand:+ start:234 stop:560 length:327 start_codon:yes stop_codon:yes gene_type:complete